MPDLAGHHDRHIEIYEVGPRDGLQNEPTSIATDQKIALIDALSAVGFRHIEATSFVSPKWVPQLGDAALVMAGINRQPGITYAALTPNQRGFDDALAANLDEIAIFAASSQTFSQKNINASIAESMARFAPIARDALANNIGLRGYVSCAIACPYDGPVAPALVRDVTDQLFDMGCYSVSLCDTTGYGQPDDIARMLDVVVPRFDGARLAGHYHDTAGHAVANVMRSLDYDIRVFDAAVAGLGGCPFAPGARGNVDTTVLAAALHDSGWHTGLDLDRLDQAARLVAHLGHGSAPDGGHDGNHGNDHNNDHNKDRF